MNCLKCFLASAVFAPSFAPFARPGDLSAPRPLILRAPYPSASDLIYFRPDLLLPQKGGPYNPVSNSLYQGLVAYWDMDATSGNQPAAFQAGSLTLTDTNTVTSATGKVGGARQFTLA